MNVTHSYITKSSDIVGITSDNSLPRNFTMHGPGLWKLWNWGEVGNATFEQELKFVFPLKPKEVIEQRLSVVVLRELALEPIRLATLCCDIVAFHFVDDGRCFLQGVDMSHGGSMFPKSANRSTRMSFDRRTSVLHGDLLGIANICGSTAGLAPMLLPEAAAEMEKVLKAL